MTERIEVPQGGGYGLPLLATASIAAALFVHPEEAFVLTRGDAAVVKVDAEDRESRLWHDPIDEQMVASAHRWQPAEEVDEAGRALLIAVPSSASFEDRESRSKTRYALHSAMTVCRYEPADATRMQVLTVLPAPDEAADDESAAGGGNAVDATAKKSAPPAGVAISVEAFVGPDGAPPITAFWLPERQLREHFGFFWPLEVMRSIGVHAKNAKLVGPSSTYSFDHTYLGSLDVFSPWVTGRDVTRPRLLDFIMPAGGGGVRKPFICRDELLATSLRSELAARGVQDARRVLLVLERDSSFARSWRGHLADAWGDGAGEFREAWFSRGLDGEGAAKGKPSTVEVPAGQGTLDYLRRLRREFRRNDAIDEVEAVGIFGQDIHDKLLILQALRPAFADAVFFTSDLHAFYTHPTQLPHTRNLIVASGHGLMPASHEHAVGGARDEHEREHEHEPEHEPHATFDDVPHADEGILTPFRDVYQTSTYLALHEAICGHEVAHPENGLVFEIGSHGPVELTDAATSPGWSLRCQVWSGLALLAVLLCGAFVHWWLAGNRWLRTGPVSYRAYRGWRAGIVFVVALCAATWLLILLSGEPASWVGGVSAWPTELLRLLSLTLSLVFAFHVVRSLRRSTTDRVAVGGARVEAAPLVVVLARSVSGAFERVFTPFSRRLRERATSDAGGRPERGLRGLPAALRECWRWLSEPGVTPWSSVNRKCVGALLLALLLGVAGRVVMLCLGVPLTPIRGALARALDTVVLIASVLAMLWLVFLVIEVARQAVARCRDAQRRLPAAGVRVDDAAGWRAHRRFLLEVADAGGKGIYGPFIVILLMCLSRWRGFDHWTWPLGLQIVVTVAGGFVLLAHVYLHKVAVRLRDTSVQNLSRTIEDVSNGELRGKLQSVLADLRGLDRGIFAGVTGHPVMRGLVIPFIGIGGLSLLQYAQSV